MDAPDSRSYGLLLTTTTAPNDNSDQRDQQRQNKQGPQDTKAHAEAVYKPLSESNRARRERELAEASEKFAKTRDRLRQWRADATAKAEEHYSTEIAEATERYDQALADAERRAREAGTEAREALGRLERL